MAAETLPSHRLILCRMSAYQDRKMNEIHSLPSSCSQPGEQEKLVAWPKGTFRETFYKKPTDVLYE